MEKTKEQMEKQREEVLKNILSDLKRIYEGGEYFSCVISVNDGVGTATLCYGTGIDLVQNVISIEDNEVYKLTKNLKKTLDKLSEMK